MIAQPQPLIEVFAEIPDFSPLSGQTPSPACHALAGLLCDAV